MEIGNKIYELRKKEGFSQEQLAEKLNVTRQTISKWELNETVPDIKQAKEISKIFKISLDELVNNDVEDFVIQKVSNLEKLSGIIIKILKFIGIAFVVLFIIDLVVLIIFLSTGKLTDVESSAVAVCEIDNKNMKLNLV